MQNSISTIPSQDICVFALKALDSSLKSSLTTLALLILFWEAKASLATSAYFEHSAIPILFLGNSDIVPKSKAAYYDQCKMQCLREQDIHYLAVKLLRRTALRKGNHQNARGHAQPSVSAGVLPPGWPGSATMAGRGGEISSCSGCQVYCLPRSLAAGPFHQGGTGRSRWRRSLPPLCRRPF